MTPQDLKKLIAAGESAHVEFKEAFGEASLESIAAFANAGGGVLFIGIADNGTVKGLQLGKETLRDWANKITQATRLNPHISEVFLKGNPVVIIEVLESQVKPVPCWGRYFKRVDKSNRQMTDDDITRLVLNKVGSSWDELVETRASLADIDEQTVLRFRILCNEKRRRQMPSEDTNSAVLEKLGLLKKGKPVRAALLLFGKEPQRWYPSAVVKIGRFRSENMIVDDKEINGTLFAQVDSAMEYFREHLQTRFEFKGTPARDVIWEYPLPALREAITNAICHRDYMDVSQIQVRWHDERILILNPGGLLPPLTLPELQYEHISKPRNHKIAEMLYYAGLIEKWGGGTIEIISSCAKAGLPEPKFEEKQGGLWVTFSKNFLTEDYLRSLGLNTRQISAVTYTVKNGRITNSEYQQLCKVSKRTASDELGQIELKGIIVKVGKTGRGTRYQLKGQQRGERGNEGAAKGQN